LGNGFRDQLWDCEEQLWDIFEAVESNSRAASAINFGEQLSGATLGSNFVNNFLEQLWGGMMRSNFQ
jgi:hypothetical protein